MSYRYARSYRSPLQALMLDWAGTTIDHGCMAPVAVFVEVFERHGVRITLEEARGPMGAHKRVHIQKLTQLDSVQARWRDAHGRLPTEADVDRLFAEAVPLQVECLARYATLIPGTLDIVAAARSRGMKIGTTTGYTAEMTAVNLEEADKQGYRPDSNVSASDVPVGRPSPAMCLQNMINLGISPVEACVKADDTRPGIEEGLNGGMWTIGLAMSGNEIGLPLAELAALPAAERERRREAAYARLYQAGAHYVVDGIADILPCLDDIEARLARGEKP